jgi:hypothetical protein
VVVTFCYFSFDYYRGHLLAPILHDGFVVLRDHLKKAKLASGPQFLIRPRRCCLGGFFRLGSRGRDRTSVDGFKVRCPAARRPGIVRHTPYGLGW